MLQKNRTFFVILPEPEQDSPWLPTFIFHENRSQASCRVFRSPEPRKSCKNCNAHPLPDSQHLLILDHQRISRSRFLTIPIMVCIDYYPIKLLIVSVHGTAITNLLAKLPFIKYPEMSNQVQIIMRKLMKMSDFEFGLLKKRL